MPDEVIYPRAEEAIRIEQDRFVRSWNRRIEEQRRLIDADLQKYEAKREKRLDYITFCGKRIRIRSEVVRKQVWAEIMKRCGKIAITPGFTPAPPQPQKISVSIPKELIQAQAPNEH